MSGFAYFISTFKDPQNIVRLVNVLDEDSNKFYVHFDKAIGIQRFKSWKKLIEQKIQTRNIKIVSEVQCRWASFGIVEATLNAMDYFENFEYRYFINLTGECYPLKSSRRIWETLKDENAGFMTFWKLPYEKWHEGGLNRIYNRFFFFSKKEYPYTRAVRLPRLRKKMPCDLKPYGGWSLFCLPKDMVSYILKFLKNNPKVVSFFKHTWIPSEIIFQTILMSSAFNDRIVNDNKRYMEFIEAHPRFLTAKDFAMLKKSEKLFARKFSPSVDSQILDMIDKELLDIK